MSPAHQNTPPRLMPRRCTAVELTMTLAVACSTVTGRPRRLARLTAMSGWLAGRLAGDASPASLPASHPLIAVNLANRRGRPVTVLHATANVMVSSTAVHRRGISRGGVFWCAGDISWLGAQVHGIYGPLACGDTTVMF